MCTKDKITSYLNVETGSLIFAFVTSISSGVLIFVMLMLMVGLNIRPPTYYFDHVVFTTLMTAGLLLIFISLVFSLLLLNGLLKTLPAYVKAYIIYGIIKSIIHVIISIILGVFMPPVAFPALVFCLIYGVILHMIRMTYCKMTSGLVYVAAPNTVSVN